MVSGSARGGRWFVLAASALGAFAATFMGTSVNVAVPSLVAAFDTSFAVVQWVVLSYLLATSALLPIIGRLADMLGKRAIFLGGFAFYVAGSIACALAPTVGWLVALRSLQGIGSAVLSAVGLAIVTDVFPAEERGRAIGLNGAVLSAGIVLGPSLGGLLVGALGWRLVFWSGVPVGLLGALLALRYVPRYRRGPRQRFDLAGAALLFSTLLALSLALTLGQERGFGDSLVAGLLLASVAGGAAFVALERRAAEPLIELALFRNPSLTVSLLAGLATFVSIAGTIFLMPFYLENVLGYPPAQVGLLMAVTPVLLVLVAPLAGWWADRVGERPVATIGLAFVLGGYLAVGTLGEGSSALGYVVRFLPLGFGMAVFQTPNNSAVMGSVPPGRSGVAGGLLALTRALGATAGIAVLGSLWAARVAARTAGAAVEAATAPPAAQVAALREMLLVVDAAIVLALALSLWELLRASAPARGGRS